MKKILIGTNNPGKVRELMAIFGGLPFQVLTLREAGLAMDVEETGATYAANATLKAVAFAQASGLVTVADDSGLEVDALGGGPGVYSARYAGPGASDAERRARLLAALHDQPPPRPARFRCVIAVATPGAAAPEVHLFEGVCAGEIALAGRGAGGFGYDPLFYLPEHQATMAELPEALKNQISHRARAAQAALPFLQTVFGRHAT